MTGGAVGVVTSYSQASQDTVKWVLEGDPEGAGSGGGDDEMTGVYGLLGAGIELLGTKFQVRPQEEDPRLGSKLGHRGLLVAYGRNPSEPCSGSSLSRWEEDI